MAIIWLSLLHYYTTFSGFLAYFFIAGKKIRISNMDFLFLCGLTLLLMFQISINDLSAVIIDLRFYWGWIIFYFIFKANVVNQKIFNDALVLLSVLTLVEAALINTVMPASTLPNFPDIATSPGDFVSEGFYQRPYSFGANATVGSSLLVTLMALCNVQGWRLWLSGLAVLVFVSGTGIFALLLLLLVRYRPLIIKTALPLFSILLCVIFLAEKISPLFELFARKTGSDYLKFLIDFKSTQILNAYENIDAYMLIFGTPDWSRGGDFGFLTFMASNGFFGFLLFLLIIFSRINRNNAFPLFLIVATSFHYPVLFFLPGQMIFGLLLSIRKDRLLDKTEPSS